MFEARLSGGERAIVRKPCRASVTGQPWVARALGGLLLALAGGAAQAEESAFDLQPLATGVYAVIDRGGSAGANAGVVVGAESIAVIDSLYQEAAARELLAAIRQLSPLPIRYVINTHHHIDHVGGNRVFAEAGATVIAQEQVMNWVRPENLRLMGGDKISEAARAQVEQLHGPRISYAQRLQIDLGGGRRLLLQHQLGHTGGDTVVSVSDAPVHFMGDLLWRRSIPNLVDATPSDWVRTLRAAAQRPDATRYVPGHGQVATPQDVRDFADYLVELERIVAASTGADEDARAAQALETLRSRYGDWSYFKGLAPRNVRDMLATLKGTKRVPLP